MPLTRSSSDLRSNYNEISSFCHSHNEPIYITKNGKSDLAIMSIENYDLLQGKLNLYGLIAEGMQDIQDGKFRPFSDAITELTRNRNK